MDLTAETTRLTALETRPKRFLALDIRARLWLLVLVAILPAPLVMLHTATEQHRLTAVSVEADALRLARVARDGHEQLIEAGRQLLTTLARLPELHDRASTSCAEFLGGLLSDHPTYANLGVARLDGTVSCSARPVTRTTRVQGRVWFRHALQSRRFAVGDYELGLSPGQPVIVLGYPSTGPAGTVHSVVFAAVDLARFSRFAAIAGLPAGSTVAVIDRQGLVLSRYPEPEPSVGHRIPEAPIIKTILSREGEGTVESVGLDGRQRLYAFTPLRGASGDGAAYVHVGIPTGVAFAESDALFKRSLALLALAGLLAWVAVWGTGELLIRRPAQGLLDATRQLAAGELRTRTGLAEISGEIGELAWSIDQMAESLERRDAELRGLAHEQVRLYEEAEHRGRESKVLADLTRDINTSLDLDTVLQRVTEGARELCKSDVARIALLNGETGTMQVRHWIGPLAEPGGLRAIEAGVGLAGRVLATGQPCRATAVPPKALGPGEAAELAIEGAIASAMVVPIRGPVRVEGLLLVANRAPRPFTDRHQHTLVQLADHAAIAIRNAQVFRQEQSVRRHAEASELRYRGLYDGVPVGLYRSTPDGQLLDANPALWQMLGYPDRASLLAADAIEFHEHPEDRREWQTRVEHDGEVRDIEVRIQRRDGRRMWMRNSARAVRDPEGRALYYEGVYQDITERKRAEEMARRSTERLLVQLQIDRAILAARSPAEVAQAALRHLRQLTASVRASLTLFDVEARQARPLAVDASSTTALRVGTYLPLEMAGHIDELRRGKIHMVEDLRPLLHLRPAQALHAEGVRSYMVVPLVARGELIGIVDVGSDRTGPFAPDQVELACEVADHLAVALQQARLQEQIQRYAAELEQRVAERTAALEETNAAMESFAYSVSHDLRAPLRAMQGFANALFEDYGHLLDGHAQEYTQRIIDAARRMDALIQDLLAYSRLSHAAVEIRAVSLEAVLAAALAQLEGMRLEETGELTVGRPLPEALGHRSTLAQVLVNLLTNAFKFAKPGERPQVRVWAERVHARVRLWIEDNGIGIAPEHHGRIFRVFERLHGVETYPGTGIGLAIVRKGVERMGGSAGVESEVGMGSRFWVELAAVDEP